MEDDFRTKAKSLKAKPRQIVVEGAFTDGTTKYFLFPMESSGVSKGKFGKLHTLYFTTKIDVKQGEES